MLGWLYVVGLLVGLVLVAGEVRHGFSQQLLAGVLIVVAWPLMFLGLAAGHGAPPMSWWARLVFIPFTVGWIALGWWAMVRAARYWLRRRRPIRAGR